MLAYNVAITVLLINSLNKYISFGNIHRTSFIKSIFIKLLSASFFSLYLTLSGRKATMCGRGFRDVTGLNIIE